MPPAAFDRARFLARLGTRTLGRALQVRDSVGSTNDAAWAAYESGAPSGATVIADAQTRGRGRLGRAWHTPPGRGLALSLLVHPVAPGDAGALPLIAGLAMACALETLGVRPALEWPNDVMLGGRKVAGILCESRRAGAAAAVVIGVGVNVDAREHEFPPELRATATSLLLAGAEVAREAVAAAFLDALETRLDALPREGAGPALAAWSARAAFWGTRVRVRALDGAIEGVALRLDDRGALVIAGDDGRERVVLAGDVRAGEGAEARP